jgi:hypothetical protein
MGKAPLPPRYYGASNVYVLGTTGQFVCGLTAGQVPPVLTDAGAALCAPWMDQDRPLVPALECETVVPGRCFGEE